MYVITSYSIHYTKLYDITSRRSINRTVLSKQVDLKDAKIITKYYLEETEGDYSDDSY